MSTVNVAKEMAQGREMGLRFSDKDLPFLAIIQTKYE